MRKIDFNSPVFGILAIVLTIIFVFGVASFIISNCADNVPNTEKARRYAHLPYNTYLDWKESPEYQIHEEMYVLMDQLLETNREILLNLEEGCAGASESSISRFGGVISPAQYVMPQASGDERQYWRDHLKLIEEQNRILRRIADNR